MEKTILPVIVGPTASGKTACAVALCQRIDGEVISADSMQIYTGMPILSAMPNDSERKGVPHHMLGFVSPGEKYSADSYRRAAKVCIEQVKSRGRIPVLCGGTGLYIDAVTRPMSFSKRSDEALHEELLEIAKAPNGKARLHAMLAKIDPESAVRLHENDIRRVARAIEIYRLTGMTQTEHTRLDRAQEGDYTEVLFGLDWPRDLLYKRIDARVEVMLQAGLVDEVRTLMNDVHSHPTAAQAIGYKEIVEALEGKCTMEHAIWCTKQATRNLAKRQMTWFRRDSRVKWLNAEGQTPESLAEEIYQYLMAYFGK